jgi:ATP-dependent Clp protease ATP-binding subunit ClpA
MSRTPVPFAPETLESIRRAFRLAADRRHDLVGLEHLLYALIEDPQARHLLNTCGVDFAQLGRDLDEVLNKSFAPIRSTADRCSSSCCRRTKATRRTS